MDTSKTTIIIYRNNIGGLYFAPISDGETFDSTVKDFDIDPARIAKTFDIYQYDNPADDICPVARYDAKKELGVKQDYNEIYDKVLIPAYNDLSSDYDSEWETQMENVSEMIRTGNFY